MTRARCSRSAGPSRGHHCGRHSTPSSDSAMRSAIETSAGSAPSAAAFKSFATTRHVALSRKCAGKCRSISSRTSASVTSFMTSGMTSGRGNGRDQFGQVRGMPLRAGWLACPSLFLTVDEADDGWRSVRARHVFLIGNGTVNRFYRRLDLYQQLAHVVSVTALVLFG